MKAYSNASEDVLQAIARMREEYHQALDGVTVAALFIYDDEASSDQVLRHAGYPAQAMVKVTPTRDRVLGVADAVIVIDRANWLSLPVESRDALVDHELYHLVRVIDEETGLPKSDAADRPKLTIKQHDHQFGWFDEIAQRHGEHSIETRQAKALAAATGQLYLDFGAGKAKQPKKPRVEERPH